MPGPIPHRDSDLSRPRERRGAAGGKAGQVATKGILKPTTMPDPDPDWHPIAVRGYLSLENSGMADFYQDTDWMTAWIIFNELSAYLRPGIDAAASAKATKAAGHEVVVRYPERRISGMMFTSIMSELRSLGMTEGERRRMRIELSDPKPTGPSAAVVAIADYQRELLED